MSDQVAADRAAPGIPTTTREEGGRADGTLRGRSEPPRSRRFTRRQIIVTGLMVVVVSIGKLAAGQAGYYLDQAQVRVNRATSVESGVEDYYVGGTEAA